MRGQTNALPPDAVRTSGNQTIAGSKTFNTGGNSYITIKNNALDVYSRPSAFAYSEIVFADKNDRGFIKLRATMDTIGSRRFEVGIDDINGSTHWTTLVSRTD